MAKVHSLTLEELSGTWRSLGYNKLFCFSAQDFSLTDLSQISSVEAARGTLSQFSEVFDRCVLDPAGRLSLFARGGITRYLFERKSGLPVQNINPGDCNNPKFIFEVFWRYFQENYAFFDLRGLDWEEVYRSFRPKINAFTLPDELLEVLTSILVTLNDSHATLVAAGREISTRKPHALVRQWQAEFHSSEFLSLYPLGIPRLCAYLQDALLNGQGKWALGRQMLWGWLRPGIGYLALFSLMDIFGGFDQLHFGGFEVANLDYLDRLEKAMDQMVAELAPAQGLVIDMRFNLGGHDAAAFAVAGHFTEQRRLALTKKAYQSHDTKANLASAFTPSQDIYIEPGSTSRYMGPLVVLTSPATASAAEVLLYCMLALPQARLVGEPSRGVLSDMLLMGLPNGWKTSLSNEVYTACDGICYEGRGVQPHILMPVFHPDDFYTGLKEPVDQALDLLGSD